MISDGALLRPAATAVAVVCVALCVACGPARRSSSSTDQNANPDPANRASVPRALDLGNPDTFTAAASEHALTDEERALVAAGSVLLVDGLARGELSPAFTLARFDQRL